MAAHSPQVCCSHFLTNNSIVEYEKVIKEAVRKEMKVGRRPSQKYVGTGE